MLEVECNKCKRHFHVKGHTTPDGWYEPGEVVTELECEDELCQCLQDGEAFTVVPSIPIHRHGQSVYEAAEALILKNRKLIQDLQDEIYAAKKRLLTQRYANMLEAERIATESEVFQQKPLDSH